jgi:hypothetical protein
MKKSNRKIVERNMSMSSIVKIEISISYTNTLVGADKHINISKLQWSCVGIKIQLQIYTCRLVKVLQNWGIFLFHDNVSSS